MPNLRTFVFLCLLLPFSSFGAQNLRILLSNDDGFEAPGIRAMQAALIEAGHTVYMIAPATQQSGSGSAINAGGVHVTAHPDNVWAVHGEPADAVRVGLGYLLYNNPPDLVVTGINFGSNTGQDVIISGTVGAALAAHNHGVPAIAVSVGIKLEEINTGFPSTFGAFNGAARLVTRVIDNMDLKDMTAVLNINYPAVLPLDVKGVRWSQLSDYSVIGKRYNRKKDGTYAPELQGPKQNNRMYDAESLKEGYVTLTFLDGIMSVAPARSQKYLDQHLLDSSFQPAPARKAPETSQTKMKHHEKPDAPASADPTPTAVRDMDTNKEKTLRLRKPVDSSIKLDDKNSTQPQKIPAGPEQPVKSEFESKSTTKTIANPDQAPEVESSILVPVEPSGDMDAQEESGSPEPSRKKKPDSWLRRMFDPGSWRK